MTELTAPTGRGGVALVPALPSARTELWLRLLALGALALTLLAVAAVLTAAVTMPPGTAARLNTPVAVVLQMVGMGGLAVAGAALARQQPRAAIAWLMLWTALAWVLSYLTLLWALWAVDRGSAAAPAVGWLSNWSWVPAQTLSMVMLLRFPTGRLPGRRWRPAELAVLTWAVVTALLTATLPGPLGAEALAPMTNPLGVGALEEAADGLLAATFAVLPVLVLVSASASVVRWRRAGNRERAALRWLAVAALVLAVSAPLALVTETGEILQGLAFLLLPTAIGAAVLRDRLWDVELRHRYDRLRTARTEERERLRHELHDSLGPALGSISMRAEAARNLLARGDAARAEELLASIGTATEDVMTEVRRLIDDLGPSVLGDQDLATALGGHLRAYDPAFPVTLRVRPDPLPPLDERAAAAAYLVVVEAVRNAARHSGGTGAVASVTAAGGRLVVEVRDDGTGLGTAPPGLGRAGMRRRAAEAGGRLQVGDVEGTDHGTVVRLELPGALQ